MKKLLSIIMIVSILGAGGAFLFKDKVSDVYEDYKMAKLVDKCFFLNREGQTIGGLVITAYDASSNMASIEGIIMGFFPLQVEAPRDAIRQAINTGEMVQVNCETGDAQ